MRVSNDPTYPGDPRSELTFVPTPLSHELRALADRAWTKDEKELSTSLHELARTMEAKGA